MYVGAIYGPQKKYRHKNPLRYDGLLNIHSVPQRICGEIIHQIISTAGKLSICPYIFAVLNGVIFF